MGLGVVFAGWDGSAGVGVFEDHVFESGGGEIIPFVDEAHGALCCGGRLVVDVGEVVSGLVADPFAEALESVDAFGRGVDGALFGFQTHEDFDNPSVIVARLVLDFHFAAGSDLGGQESGEEVGEIV